MVVAYVAILVVLIAFDSCISRESEIDDSEIDTITVRVTGFEVGGNDPCNTLDPDRVLKNIIIREGETTVARVTILRRDAEVWRNWGRHKRRCVIRVEQAVRVPNVDSAAVTVTGDGETKTLPIEEGGCLHPCFVYVPIVGFVARGSDPRGTAVGAQD
jgi:hypothetical protein